MMVNSRTSQRPFSVTMLRGLVLFDAVALLFAAALHVAGAHIPIGSAVFDEPQIVSAAIVEGIAGLLFVVSAYAIFASRLWAWRAALIAHLFAIAGFIVGLIATRGGTSVFNFYYHRVMLVIFVVGLVLLALPSARVVLGRVSRGA